MRVVFVLPGVGLVGGVRTVAMYAHHLGRRGHRVTVVSRSGRTTSARERVRSLFRGRWLATSRPDPSYFEQVGVECRVLGGDDPLTDRDVPDADAVIATYWITAEWVAALSARKGAKLQFVQGDDADTPGVPGNRIDATWRLPLHRIVCSRWLQDLARKRYGVTAALVPNGVDGERFSAPVRGKQPVPTVGMIYVLQRPKGCDVAIGAFEAAARRVPGLRLVAFGATQAQPELPLPRGTEFHWRPAQPRIPEIYARCDAWLWPSRREGFGLPILEAMACRTPVIAAPAGAAPELLQGGGGELLAASDVSVLADAIVRICSGPDPEWRLLSARARATAERYTWSASAARFEEAMEDAVRAERANRRATESARAGAPESGARDR